MENNVYSNAYLISRGVRDISSILIPLDELDKSIEEAGRLDIKIHVVGSTDKSHSILLYKEDYIKDVYLHFKSIPGSNPVRHWGLGHLFGYGRHEINEFIKNDSSKRK